MYNWMIFKFLSGVDELSLPFLGKINRYLYSSLELEIFYFFTAAAYFIFCWLVCLFVCTLSLEHLLLLLLLLLLHVNLFFKTTRGWYKQQRNKLIPNPKITTTATTTANSISLN